MSDWKRNILNHPHDALALVQPETFIILDVNKQFLQKTKRTRDEVIGKPCEALCLENVPREKWNMLVPALNEKGYIQFSVSDQLELTIQQCDEQTLLVRYDWDSDAIRAHYHEVNERLRLLTDVAVEGVVFIQNDIITDANHQFARMLGYVENTDVIGRAVFDFFSKTDLHRIHSNARISVNNKHEAKTTHTDGRIVFMEVTASEAKLNEVETLVMVLNDVTTKKRTEISLQQSVLSFQRLIENSANGVVILWEGKIQYANRAACELFGVEDEDALFDQRVVSYVAEESKELWKDHRQAAEDGLETDYIEIKFIDAHGNLIDVGVNSTLTVYENKPSVQVTLNNVTARNQLVQEQMRLKIAEEINSALKEEIEEHRETQRKLQKQQTETAAQKAKLEAIYNSTENLMVCTLDKEFRITAQNKNLQSWLAHSYEEKVELGSNLMDVLHRHTHPDFYQGQLTDIREAFEGRSQQFEFALIQQGSQVNWVEAFINPIYIEGKISELSCVFHDNTERKEIDRKIRESLKEKEVLLREVHHRVKNNLQVISSILSLQSSYVSDPAILDILKESQQRIKSMSFIHETLYRTADFSKIEFTDYLRTIAINLVQSYASNRQRITLDQQLQPVYLGLDQSIPCGLIVNELISNSLKYAFQGRDEGVIQLSLSEMNDTISLSIKDDGVGLPKDFNYEKTNSLGIQLVYALIEQLDATMDIRREEGTEFKISFKRR